eukprot:6207316-Pleurochrysis_carterae.AAC.1
MAMHEDVNILLVDTLVMCLPLTLVMRTQIRQERATTCYTHGAHTLKTLPIPAAAARKLTP